MDDVTGGDRTLGMDGDISDTMATEDEDAVVATEDQVTEADTVAGTETPHLTRRHSPQNVRTLEQVADDRKELAIDTPKSVGSDPEDNTHVTNVGPEVTQDHDEVDPEMTQEQREAMHRAVLSGDVDLLDDLLDIPGADIHMEWYGESLLMAAIRAKQEDMALFLVDNGVDFNCEAAHYDVQELSTKDSSLPSDVTEKTLDCYTITCRQMAYDAGLSLLVEVIDEKNGDLWSFQKPPQRVIRLKKPLEEKLRERAEAEEAGEAEEAEEGEEGEHEEETGALGGSEAEMADEDLRSTTGSESDMSLSPKPPRPRSTECLVREDPAMAGKSDMVSSGYGSFSDLVCSGTTLLPERHPRRYRETKSYISRRKANNARQNEDIEIDDLSSNQPSDSNERKATPRRGAPSLVRGMNRSKSACDVARMSRSRTRFLSPWEEDNPLVIWHLRKRSSSAQAVRREKLVKAAGSGTTWLSGLWDCPTTGPDPLGKTVRTHSTLYSRSLRQHAYNSDVTGVRTLSIHSPPDHAVDIRQGAFSDTEEIAADEELSINTFPPSKGHYKLMRHHKVNTNRKETVAPEEEIPLCLPIIPSRLKAVALRKQISAKRSGVASKERQFLPSDSLSRDPSLCRSLAALDRIRAKEGAPSSLGKQNSAPVAGISTTWGMGIVGSVTAGSGEDHQGRTVVS